MANPSKYEVEILDQIHAEGFKQGTDEFNVAFLARKVMKCQELHNVPSCQVCHYFDNCEMAKANLVNMRFASQKPKVDDALLASQIFPKDKE